MSGNNIERTLMDKAVTLVKERNVAKKDFLKNLITIGTGFLALFVGFKSDAETIVYAKIFFFITILMLVLAIILSSISLYVEFYYYKIEIKWIKDTMKKYYNGTLSSDEFMTTKEHFGYKIAERFAYLFYFFSIISLLIYVYFLELYSIFSLF